MSCTKWGIFFSGCSESICTGSFPSAGASVFLGKVWTNFLFCGPKKTKSRSQISADFCMSSPTSKNSKFHNSINPYWELEARLRTVDSFQSYLSKTCQIRHKNENKKQIILLRANRQ